MLLATGGEQQRKSPSEPLIDAGIIFGGIRHAHLAHRLHQGLFSIERGIFGEIENRLGNREFERRSIRHDGIRHGLHALGHLGGIMGRNFGKQQHETSCRDSAERIAFSDLAMPAAGQAA